MKLYSLVRCLDNIQASFFYDKILIEIVKRGELSMAKSIQKLLSEEEKVEQQLKDLRKKIKAKKKEEENKLALKLGKILLKNEIDSEDKLEELLLLKKKEASSDNNEGKEKQMMFDDNDLLREIAHSHDSDYGGAPYNNKLL